MYRPIIVPLDGSAFAEQALVLAGPLAQRMGATLQLVHVHVPVVQVGIGTVALGQVPTEDTALDEQQRSKKQSYLETVRQRLLSEARLPVTCTMLDGPAAEALTREAAAAESALIVMTTHGYGPLSRVWLGSVADALIRQSPVPVMLIRPQETTPESDWPSVIRHILVPLDGSALAEQIVAHALELGAFLQAHYTLLHVFEPRIAAGYPVAPITPAYSDEQDIPELEQAGQYLEGISQRLRGEGHHVESAVLSGGQPAAVIVEYARQNSVDLIAMATHGRGGLERMLLGSVADKVLRSAEVPVLLYRPQVSSDEAGV